MLRTLPMRHVTVYVLASEAADTALVLAAHGQFAPAADGEVPWGGNPAESYRQVWLQATSRLQRILQWCGLEDGGRQQTDSPARPQRSGPSPLEEARVAAAPTLAELEALHAWLGEVWQACSRCHDEHLRLEAEQKRLVELEQTYARLTHLDLDVTRLLRADALLKVRLGQVPSAHLKRLQEALALAGHVLIPFDQAQEMSFALVAGPRPAAAGVDDLLTQAGWRELPVPQELQTHPAAARAHLEQEKTRIEALAGACRQSQAEHAARYGARLQEAAWRLELARPLAEAAALGVHGSRQITVFTGWVPRRAQNALVAALEARLHGRYRVIAREPHADELDRVPSLLAHPRWLRPFTPLVRNYGLPCYGEFDPTLLFAFSYVLLFGAMFGDVGHGAAIFLLAAGLRGRLAWLRTVGMACGAASIAFGFVYGSVFGHEDLLPALWRSPMHDPQQLLTLAMVAGAGFIAATHLLHAYNRLNQGQVAAALFEGAGLAGLVFYASVLDGLHALYLGQGFGPYHAAGACLALGAITVHRARTHRATAVERILVALIETSEAVIRSFANTLSFLRVAAFSLNHVALSFAVFALAGGLGGVGREFTLILGHALIVVLEGGIVAIQCMRLMYYEGFARFYNGGGVEFRPLRLGGRETSLTVGVV
ncbi:MAG: hypothetical protein NZ524_06765 [Thiobacillaceae bacterium]|nr:hypothetical protein [Thiobacillaceae bacterium]